jgi:hypothetical protein
MAWTPIWKRWLIFLALAAGARPSPAGTAPDSPLRRCHAESLAIAGSGDDEACLILPVSLAYDAAGIYVVDARDCAVKVFSKRGRFKTAIGRKGHGPGEFSFPSGISAFGGRLYVADKLNGRIQVFEASGRYLWSFGVPFAPDKIAALGPDRILVTHNPSGRRGAEKMLHVFNGRGYLLWEELDSIVSDDPIADAFRNMILVNPGPRGGCFVVFKSRERSILHFGGDGRLLRRIEADERYRFKSLSLTVSGPRRDILAFCWASAFDRDRFYLLAPGYTEENDVGPGDEVFVFAPSGRLEAVVSLPVRVSRIAVEGDRIYAVDAEDQLRIFRIGR